MVSLLIFRFDILLVPISCMSYDDDDDDDVTGIQATKEFPNYEAV